MANPLFDRLLGCHAGKDAVFLHLPDGRTMTYAAFLGRAAQFANAISSLGVVPGDRLAMQVEKSAEALAIYAACVQSGVVMLPLNVAYTPAEVEYFVRDSGAALVLCPDADKEEVTRFSEPLGAKVHTLNADGTGSMADLAQSQPTLFQTVSRKADDLAAILYTSGTTGRSKGAMLTQDNLLSNAIVLAQTWRFTADDVLLHALPIFHTHGLFVASNVSMITGGSMIFLPKFDVDAIVSALPKSTVMMGVPTFYTRLLDDPRLSSDLTRSMRLFTSGSAPLLAESHVQFHERTGHHILERYGMTETNMNTSNPYDGERRAGTVGFPLDGVELKITNPDDGQTLPDGDTGQIEVRGANVFAGYWQMPEKTRTELREGGFFQTGDLGRIDADGYVHIVGRIKDLIISGGYNIYPKEVEMVLDDVPGVRESAVIGVPHPDLGEAVVAVLVPDAGASLDGAEVAKMIAGSLARFKQPKHYEILTDLPRNTMGKVQKNVLRDQFARSFAVEN